jgi:hypothetical protein
MGSINGKLHAYLLDLNATQVPEPGVSLLFGSSLAALGLLGGRRQRR